MNVLLSAIVLIGFVAIAQSGTPTITGPCPDFKPMENVDATKAAGDWFELGCGIVGNEVDKTKPEKTVKCAKKTLTQTPAGFDSVATYLDQDNKTHTKKGSGAKIAGAQAKFTITGEELPIKPGTTVTLSIIDTDYTNIMLVAGCFSDGTKHGYTFGVMGRQKSYPAAEFEKVNTKLKAHGITAPMKMIDQSC